MLDLEDIADVVATAVNAATAPLIAANAVLAERLAAVEAREMPTAIKGDDGEVDMEQVAEIVQQHVREAVAAIPAPKDGESVDLDEIKRMIDEAMPELPVPVPVEPDSEAIAAVVADSVSKAVSALPEAKDGDNGIGLADALIDKDGNLVITMTDGRTKTLGKVVGEDGEAGKTFTLDDFDIEQTDERVLTFKFLRGDTMHSFEFEFPIAIYRGVWIEQEYQRGDMVTWAGSVWHADKATSAKPDTPDSGWKLAVKRGRDGKDAKP